MSFPQPPSNQIFPEPGVMYCCLENFKDCFLHDFPQQPRVFHRPQCMNHTSISLARLLCRHPSAEAFCRWRSISRLSCSRARASDAVSRGKQGYLLTLKKPIKPCVLVCIIDTIIYTHVYHNSVYICIDFLEK